MTDNEFDDILKKRLRDYEADVPADMWQRIAAKNKKRRGGYGWHYMGALLLLLLGYGVYVFYIAGNKKTGAENIAARTKNNMKKAGNNDSADHINEPGTSTAGINKNNPVDFAADKNKSHVPERLFYKNKPIIKNNSEQTFITDNNMALQKQEHTDSTMYLPTNQDNIKKSVEKKQITSQTADSDADITKENEDYNKISLQLFVSPDMPFGNIHSSDRIYQELLQKATGMKLSYTIGAGISMAVSKKISLSTGIQYTRVNEKISFEDSVLTDHHNTVNHFTFINVPFTVKYKTAWTTSFQTSIHAGILLNISSKYKGIMPDAFGETTDINHNVYKRYTGVSLYGGINFSKAITKKTDVFAEPYFRYQTKNITDNLQPFTRRFYTAGIALGIQCKLFKIEQK